MEHPVGGGYLTHSFWTKCVPNFALNHGVDSDSPMFACRKLLIQLQLIRGYASVMHTNYTELV